MKKVLLISLSILNQVLNAMGYININVFGTGLYLPYSIGVVGYIKKHVNITDKTDYRINGISGGAWCSLLYTQEDDLSDHDKIWDYAIGGELTNIKLQNDMKSFQKNVENNLKNRYKNKDAKNLNKISIISTKIVGNFFNMDIEKKSNFDNIEDLINFCLCSSYLPYLSGNSFSREYKGSHYIDGDIKYNYKNQKDKLTDEENVNNIIIHKNMWGRTFSAENYIYIDKDKSRKLFQQGWEDTEKNIDFIHSKIKN